MKDLCEENKYPHNLDVTEIFDTWEGHKHDNILTYRLEQYGMHMKWILCVCYVIG